MSAPKRISIKFFAKNPEVVEIEAFTAILQRWIQDRALDGLLIDVVDYKHMYEGPGIILIGDLADYGMDSRDGRLGMMLTIKRHDQVTLTNLLQYAFPLILKAAKLMETEDAANGLVFDFSEAKLEFLDRLNYANSPETLANVEADLRSFANDIFKQELAITQAHRDPRETFAVTIKAEGDVTGEQLLANLATPLTQSQ